MVFIASEVDGKEIKYVNLLTQDNQEFEILGSKMRTLIMPCHTKGHQLYYFESLLDTENPTQPDSNLSTPFKEILTQRCIFTGDTLFIGGCGRFFEGNAEQMLRNMDRLLAEMPDETHIFCGHEYTSSNY